MKKLFLIVVGGLLTACSIKQDGVVINTPTVPTVLFCQNVATDADAASMAENIKAQAFKDEKLARARIVTKIYCFVSQQVLTILDAFSFEDDQLTMAKELYKQTTDKSNYTIVVDSFTFKSNRDELTAYIQNNP